MAATNFAGGSTKTLPATLGVGRHDGHADGHLNCVALRHGWSRTFSIPSTELAVLDYDTLETILEINTLKLRPIGLRIYVENPADSGNWSKIRYWKHDGSLQTTLVQAFFEQRRIAGTTTRLDIRDGSERHAEGDTLSLRTVGSRILNRKHDDNKSNTSGTTRWWGVSRNNSTSSRKDRMVSTDAEDDGEHGIDGIHMGPEDDDHPRPRPPPASTKPSFFSLLRPHPKIPNQQSKRRSIFDFFREKITTNITSISNIGVKNKNPRQRIPEETPLDNTGEPEAEAQRRKQEEVEQLRKRGWIPPGLIRRHRSLKDRLRAEGLPSDGSGGSRNPFFGSSKSILNRAERKKAAMKADDNEDPFADENQAGDQVHGPIVLTEEDIDDFFEVEAPTSTEMANMPMNERSWSKFKPSKDRKNKDKGKEKEKAQSRGGTPPNNGSGTLGTGAAIVAKPRDAFPDSPHHRAADAMAAEAMESEVD